MVLSSTRLPIESSFLGRIPRRLVVRDAAQAGARDANRAHTACSVIPIIQMRIVGKTILSPLSDSVPMSDMRFRLQRATVR
jgi:hypothetical protein